MARELHDVVVPQPQRRRAPGRRRPRRRRDDPARPRWRRSSAAAARRSSRCAGCSACCARTTTDARSRRSPASRSSPELVARVRDGRAAGRARGRGRLRGAAAGRRPVRVPDRPGGADQRAQARRARRARAWRAARRRTQLTIDVVDDGAGADGRLGDGGGHGLARHARAGRAVRRRAERRPRPGGGFAVHARLPLVDAHVIRVVHRRRPGPRARGPADDARRRARHRGRRRGRQRRARRSERARELDPDVLLMDIRMPELDGIEATARLVARRRTARVLVLTTFDLDEYVYRAMKAGASGFLLKDANREQLAAAVRTVAAGDALLAPSITRRLIEDYCRRRRRPAGPPAGARGAQPARARGAAAGRAGAVERGDRAASCSSARRR